MNTIAHWTLAGLMMLAQAGDFITTRLCISTGFAGESNPLMVSVVGSPATFATVKMVGGSIIAVIAIMIGVYASKNNLGTITSKSQYIPYVFAGLLSITAVVNNLAVLQEVI